MKIMNRTITILLSALLLPTLVCASTYMGLSGQTGKMVPIPNPNNQLLPNPFPIFTDGHIVVNHPADGFKKVGLPVDNTYRKNPGCYLACYSKQKGVYEIASNIYVQGMVRVPGKYVGRICRATGAPQDISKLASFKKLCGNNIKLCRDGSCWVGGDTGGWYGMQINQ